MSMLADMTLGYEEAARDMPTWQTGISYGGESEWAVDGNTGGGVWAADTCSSTAMGMYGELHPTWGVQLRGDDGFDVYYVTITNSFEFCKLGITFFFIYIFT